MYFTFKFFFFLGGGGGGRGSEEYYCLGNFIKFQPFKGVGVGGSRPPTPL